MLKVTAASIGIFNGEDIHYTDYFSCCPVLTNGVIELYCLFRKEGEDFIKKTYPYNTQIFVYDENERK